MPVPALGLAYSHSYNNYVKTNKPALKSLVTIRMNEIFPCLACYGQKLIFFVRKSRQR